MIFSLLYRRKGFVVRLTPLARRLVIVCLFGLNLVSGYLAMLVAMTYSIELFACVVFGLCLGHFVFNTRSVVGESIDPCCVSQQQAGIIHGSSQSVINHISRTPCDPEVRLDPVEREELCHLPSPSPQHHQQVANTTSNGLNAAILPSSPGTSSHAVVVNCCDVPACANSAKCSAEKLDLPPSYSET